MKKRSEYQEWVVQNFPCEINDENCTNYLQPAHVRSKGAGGKDFENIVCLCGPAPFGHHGEQHTTGIKTFQDKYKLDMKARAVEVQREWDENH